ncbi:hypothetical protein, conserved [Eimeria praecox]|uniref:Uncharacterized protein n=1 Tax=Eimeria praecox TaxID=51316 RepID=U6H410_9EIME|nr:hypothetical protein, conserved [Eimeria praecox]
MIRDFSLQCALSLERLRHPTVCVGFHELDACNDMSMAAFSQNLKKKFGSIDILIDSAGVLPTTTELGCKGDTDHIMAVDYHATKIDLDEVADGFVEEFCTAGSSGRRIYDALAYPFAQVSSSGRRIYDALAYPFAQATRIALAQYMGNQLKLSSPDPKMRVTVCSFSPGWCRAPSAGNRAPFSAREGANEAVYAAFDANAEEVQGSFLIGRKPAKFGDEIGAIDTSPRRRQ